MICVLRELIDEQLEHDRSCGFEYRYVKPSNRLIDKLFRHYYAYEVCEHFYDSEPEFDSELFSMYMDYAFKEHDGLKYSKCEHTPEELKAAYDEVKRTAAEYEPRRIRFCNWQEVYCKGNWGMTQSFVNAYARRILKKNIRAFPYSIKERFFFAQKDSEIRVYFYGRDLIKVDYWIVLKK